MAVTVEIVDAVGIQRGGSSLDAVHGVALAQEEIRQIGAILAGDAGDEGHFLRLLRHVRYLLFTRKESARQRGPSYGCQARNAAPRGLCAPGGLDRTTHRGSPRPAP